VEEEKENPTPLEKKTDTQHIRWVFYLTVFTPSYIAASIFLIGMASNLIDIDNHVRLLALPVLIVFYFLIGALYLYPAVSKGRHPDETEYLTNIRGITPLFTDEIDVLVVSIKTMQKNLKAQQAELIESREKMQELAHTTLRSQEAERRYISRELHDQAGQLLVSLRSTVEALLSDFSPVSSPQAAPNLKVEAFRIRLSTMLKQIDQTLETVRALSHKMRPALLDVGDINLAMQEYCSEFQQDKNIRIEYEGASLPFLTEDVSIGLFRFLQEALTNVLKHADASHVHVRLMYENGSVKMSVADNGRGEAADTDKKGIGILGMKERFLLLGGTVEANPGLDGFTITAQIPLTDSEEFFI
jgi:signal transduction histidine kinase